VISGFHHEVDEICALLGYYSTFSANSLPTLRDNISVRFLGVKNSKKKVNRESKNFLTSEDETDRLSRNVGKELSFYAA
jgi:hypothetical protein